MEPIVNYVFKNPRTAKLETRPLIVTVEHGGKDNMVNGMIAHDGMNDVDPKTAKGPNGEVQMPTFSWAGSVKYRSPERDGKLDLVENTWHFRPKA